MKYIDIADIARDADRKKIIQSYSQEQEVSIGIMYLSDFESAKILRDVITNLSDIFGITSMWKSRLILIADELNNNAIEYGSSNQDSNVMRVTIVKDQDKNQINIQLEVEDSGKGKHAKSSVEMSKLRAEKKGYNFDDHESIRGRGLFLIISKLVEDLYFKDSERGGLIVGIRKTISL